MGTEFRGTHRDVPPVVEGGQVEDEGDHNPCPQDEADFIRPDAEEMEEAISKLMDGIEKQKCGVFNHIHTFLSKLPVPQHAKRHVMTHAVAIEGCFLPIMSEDEQKRFTPSELMLKGKLASLNCSQQSKEGAYSALGMAGIEPTPSKSEGDWTQLSPLTTLPRGQYQVCTGI